jgi:hypothetical protein
MLGEFFAARPEEVDERLVEEGPFERLPTVEAKGLSELTFAALGEILGVGTYDDLVERAAEGPQKESGEAGILRLPSEIRDALPATEDLALVAERWAATEELAGFWPPDELHDVLRDLSRLARDARSSGRELWYWWSL